MDEDKKAEFGAGPYPVTEISHCTYQLKDGVRIAMKVWLPCKSNKVEKHFPYFAAVQWMKWSREIYTGSNNISSEDRFASILEYLPYGKDTTLTLQRDHSRHTWFCSHGFVDFRVDVRGTGVSQGHYFDEYDESEMEDCFELIEWISTQPWSNGNVGMYGKSWGGFNGLQMAYKQPPGLKTVISLYSTDNRYTDDVHYEGGAIIANGMLSWAGTMMALDARPPHPRYCSSVLEWKKVWLDRLENRSQSFLCTWLHHQSPSDLYWKHGSICEDYSRVKCPVLIIGGYSDAYVNAAFRMAGYLNGNCRAVIGPWSHQWPDVSVPGPNIDYLSLCLKWWSAYLKNDKSSATEVINWDRLQLFVKESHKVEAMASSLPGLWVSISDWDERLRSFLACQYANNDSSSLMEIYLGKNKSVKFTSDQDGESNATELKAHPSQGSGCGSWFYVDIGAPTDQTRANQYSDCWVSDVLENDVTFAGLSKMYLTISVKKYGQHTIHVRICDQIPSGESVLVTRGFLNLSSDVKGWVSHFPVNTKTTVCVNLKGVAHTIKRGNKVLVSVTPTYFPMILPAILVDDLKFYPLESKIILQTLNGKESCNNSHPCPKPLLQLPVKQMSSPSFTVDENMTDGVFEQHKERSSGNLFYQTMGFHYEDSFKEKYVVNGKMSSPVMSGSQVMKYEFEELQNKPVRIETDQEMKGTTKHFRVKENIKVTLDDEVLFNKTWDNIVPRKYV